MGQRSRAKKQSRIHGQLAVVASLLCVAALIIIASGTRPASEPAWLGLSDLHGQSDAMSCADAPSVPLNEAPQWCSGSSAAQCLPVLPPHRSADLWHGTPAALTVVLPVPVRSAPRIMMFGAPRMSHAPARTDLDPPERPPRA